MQTYRKIIETNILASVIQIPQNMMNKRGELTITILPERVKEIKELFPDTGIMSNDY
jgi:tRNA1(Val) A37 N6-methylase TrmN6